MKRTWTIFTLLFAGLIVCSNLQANSASSFNAIANFDCDQSQRLTDTEVHILQKAAPVMEIAYSELSMLYESGDATIEPLGNNEYRVTAYSSSGNPIIAVIESSL